MTEKEIMQVFAENLKNYLAANNMSQIQLAALLGVSSPTVTDWIKARKSPRISKVDKMCEIFGCSRSDLMDKKSNLEKTQAELLNRVFTEQKALLSATDGLTAEDIQILITMAERLKAGYRDE